MPWLLVLLLLSTEARADWVDPNESASRPANAGEVSAVQNYGRNLGKGWIKDVFKIDVDTFGIKLGRKLQSAAGFGENGEQTVPGTAPYKAGDPRGGALELYQLDLRIDQVGDLRRLSYDRRDIPFALKFHADGSLLASWLKLRTDVFIPFSWKDELRAEALIPLPDIGINPLRPMEELLGITPKWDLHSAYTNQLGASSLEAGLGSQWLKTWNLNLLYQVRFGQGQDEKTEWLKLGKSF